MKTKTLQLVTGEDSVETCEDSPPILVEVTPYYGGYGGESKLARLPDGVTIEDITGKLSEKVFVTLSPCFPGTIPTNQARQVHLTELRCSSLHPGEENSELTRLIKNCLSKSKN